MISSAAPTKPKVEREAFPIPGPCRGKKKRNILQNALIPLYLVFPQLLLYNIKIVEITTV